MENIISFKLKEKGFDVIDTTEFVQDKNKYLNIITLSAKNMDQKRIYFINPKNKDFINVCKLIHDKYTTGSYILIYKDNYFTFTLNNNDKVIDNVIRNIIKNDSSMECEICYEESISMSFCPYCNHQICKECFEKIAINDIVECVVCRKAYNNKFN